MYRIFPPYSLRFFFFLIYYYLIASRLTVFSEISQLIFFISPHQVVVSIKDFVRATLGNDFIEMPPLDVSNVYADSSASTPVLFVLAPGGDPSEALQRFARSRGMGQRLTMLSLGRDFGGVAADAVRRAMRAGDWVFLQNLHLAASWMPKLEQAISSLHTAVSSRDPALNLTFRLWLSTAPDSCVPVNVMQAALKVCVEPPQGVRATLLGTFMAMLNPPAASLASVPAVSHTNTRTGGASSMTLAGSITNTTISK